MSRFPGVGQRVRQRLRALGYWKDGRPDVGRFCSERDYRPQYLYAWLGDRIPTYDNLARLARDLEVPPEWVMFGTGSPTRRDALDAPSAVSPEFALGAKRYEARLLPLPAESGAQRQLLMIVRDITERKQAEEAATVLARVGHELAGTLDLEEATARVVTAVLHHFRVDRACFFELDRISGNLLCVATAGELGDAQWTGRMIPAGASVAALAAQECRPVAARDVPTDPRVDLPAWLPERAAVEGPKSGVAVALVSPGQVLGALSA